MITDEAENELLYRRVTVKADSPKYPNRRGVIVGISGAGKLYAHVDLDAYGRAPQRRREMFLLGNLIVHPEPHH